MHYRLHILALCFLILMGQADYSQAQNTPQIEITDILNWPDTAYEGQVYDSLYVQVVLSNPAGAAYVGNIGVGYMTDTVPLPRFMYLDTLPNVLATGDTMLFKVDGFQFDPASFREGGNVIVVWPITPVIPHDSLYLDVYFVKALSIGYDESPKAEIVLFPNPVESQLNVRIVDNHRPEHVRIFSQTGSLLYDKEFTEPRIDVASFPAGVYFFELRFRDAIPSRQTFLKASR